MTHSAPVTPIKPAEDAADNLGRIRDILFGSAMSELREELRQQGEALEAKLARSHARLIERMDRLDAELRTELTGLRDGQQQALSDEATRLDTALAEAREAATAEQNRLREDLSRSSTELNGRLEAAQRELGADKAGRRDLARLLGSLAAELERDPSPTAE